MVAAFLKYETIGFLHPKPEPFFKQFSSPASASTPEGTLMTITFTDSITTMNISRTPASSSAMQSTTPCDHTELPSTAADYELIEPRSPATSWPATSSPANSPPPSTSELTVATKSSDNSIRLLELRLDLIQASFELQALRINRRDSYWGDIKDLTLLVLRGLMGIGFVAGVVGILALGWMEGAGHVAGGWGWKVFTTTAVKTSTVLCTSMETAMATATSTSMGGLAAPVPRKHLEIWDAIAIPDIHTDRALGEEYMATNNGKKVKCLFKTNHILECTDGLSVTVIELVFR